MTPADNQNWDPEAYARFRGLRLRPALDLLAQVGPLPDGDVIDLGCGNGPVGPALRQRFGDRRLVGLDASAEMLAKAKETGAYDALLAADIAAWTPETPPALIFSNAALQWLGDHATLMPSLVERLAPGGVLAVQMPRQDFGPSHALARSIAEELFPDRFDYTRWEPPVAAPEVYADLLEPLGEVLVWETIYQQKLAASEEGHPVRNFTASTYLKRIFPKLDATEVERYLATYDARLAEAYPLRSDGSTWLPFRRLFFVAQRG